MSQQLIDPTAARDALAALIEPGQVFEIRALEASLKGNPRTGTVFGYFDDPDKAATALRNMAAAVGVYFTPNPIDPALLARSLNRLQIIFTKRSTTTADHDVTKRRWLLIDVDPCRVAGVSSSDAEHEAALAAAAEIRNHLREAGWPAPVAGDSGNGAHIMYPIDVEAEDDGLIENCLKALAEMFNDATVKLDTGVYNPARIWKLYGSRACKGDSTPDRPHRMARLLTVPAALEVVPMSLLQELADKAPSDKPVKSNRKAEPSNGKFDIDTWISHHNVPVGSAEKWKSGRRWVFDVCPFNSDHNNRSAVIVEQVGGKLGFTCHHNGCSGKDWHALRMQFERGWKPYQAKTQRNDNGRAGHNGQHTSATEDGPPRGTLKPTWLSAVTPEAVEWLWCNRVALGKLTLVMGNPGLGKSFLTCDMAARVSLGECWPDGAPCPEGRVLMFSAEDGVADTIRPRFDAAGGDPSKVACMNTLVDENGKHLPFSLDTDLPMLEELVRELGDVKAVIIDPISCYLGDSDSHKNADVRAVLAGLADMADKHHVAVIVVTHLNKNSGQSAGHRATGSIAFTAAARAVWLVAEDRDDEADHKRSLLLPIKNNLAPKQPGLAFRIDRGRLVWEEGTVDTDPDEALAVRTEKRERERDKCKAAIKKILSEGPLATIEMNKRLAPFFSESTIERARAEMGISAKPAHGKHEAGRWHVSLEDPAEMATIAHVRGAYNPDDY